MFNRLLTTPPTLTTTPESVPDFEVEFEPNQVAIIEPQFQVSFPENHGGLQYNIKFPTTSGWVFFRIDPWTWRNANSSDNASVVGLSDPATPVNPNYEGIGPGNDAIDYVLKSKWLIKAPSGGGTLKICMGTFTEDATPSLVAGFVEVTEVVKE